jgi:restriction endonuclease S subunit
LGTIGDGYLGPAFHRKFVSGQVLYGSRRTYLRKVAVAEFDGVCANTTFVLDAKEDVLLQELLPFIMQTEGFTQHSILHSKGSVNPYVNWKDIACYEFPLPPLDEQRRIADILWAADAAVTRFEDALQQMATLKCSALAEWTIRGLKDGHRRQTRIGNIPSHWKLAKVGELLEACQYGLSIRAENDGQYPILRMMNIEDGLIVPNDLRYVNLPDAGFADFRVEPGDILFNRTNSADLVGKVGIFFLEGDYVFASYLVRLRVKRSLVSPEYLNYYLNSPLGQRRILSYATPGVSQTNINANNLQKVLVPLPPRDEQEAIAANLRQIDASKKAILHQLERLRELKSRLLSKLL